MVGLVVEGLAGVKSDGVAAAPLPSSESIVLTSVNTLGDDDGSGGPVDTSAGTTAAADTEGIGGGGDQFEDASGMQKLQASSMACVLQP